MSTPNAERERIEDTQRPENTCQKHFCERCGEELNPATLVWLELNTNTGRYHEDGMVPVNESQGSFTFGAACAASVLKNGGRNVPIRSAAR